MANTYLPPQAFTKEDLTRAYVWVQSQPDYVKNMATSKDALVALYLQAKRNGIASLENIAPVSSRDFKTQLESLASELNQFEKSKTTTAAPVVAQKSSIPQTPEFAQSFEERMEFKPQPETPRYDERSIELKVSERRVAESNLSLDPRSLEIINTVKYSLNLETDTDVIRMLITLGYEKIKDILPQK